MNQNILQNVGKEFKTEIKLNPTTTIFIPINNPEYTNNIKQCKSCKSSDLIYCSHESETVCTNCGLVQDIIYQDEISFQSTISSKKYNRIVHFRERTAAWENSGPIIPDEDFELIEDYYWSLKETNKHLLGRNLLSQICEKVGLGQKKYGERWIHVRIRLGLQDDWTCPDVNLIKEMHIRFYLINMAFQYCIHISSTSSGIPIYAKRRNIIPLNYVILQLLRIISEEEFLHWKRYFMIINFKTLSCYNYYWKEMIEWLKTNQSLFINRDSDENIAYNWIFKPLTQNDLYISPEFMFN